RAEIVPAGDRKRIVAGTGRPYAIVALVGDAEIERSSVVEGASGDYVRVPELRQPVAVVAAVRIAGCVSGGELQRGGKALERRRLVADRVAEPRVEPPLRLAQCALCPQRRGRENRGCQCRRVAENRMNVVVRRQEIAELHRAPVALEADPGFARGKR